MRFVWCVWLVLYLAILSTTFIKVTEGMKPSKALQKMSLDALQTLLERKGEDALETITGVTFLYRMDLPSNYAAYYEVVYDNEYYIVSAGPQTGDFDVPRHGDNPPPTKHVRDTAKRLDAKCKKFYVFRTLTNVMCADSDGKFIATDIPDLILVADVMGFGMMYWKRDMHDQTNDTFDVTMFNSYITSRADVEAEMWQQYAENVTKMKDTDYTDDVDEIPTTQGIDESLDTRSQEDGWAINLDERKPAENESESFRANEIIPGDTKQVVVGPRSVFVEVRVKFVVTDTKGNKEADLEDHQKLCSVMRGCDTATVTKDYALLSAEHIGQHKYFVDIELLPETEETYHKKEFVFTVDIVKKDGSVTTRYFGVSYSSGKEKRAYYYYYYYGVNREDLFPNYVQLWNGNGNCVVGCVPVAWAMIFGYYDRRSHLDWYYWRSKGLYRNGIWGIHRGDWEVAPTYVDWRMRNYIRYLSLDLKTYCSGGSGWTSIADVDNVRSFFQQRQSGSPNVIYGSNWYWVRDRLRHHFPSLLGRQSHAVVVTRMYYCYKRYYYCYWVIWPFWRRCYWRTILWFNSMYLHMGWGPGHDNWVATGNYPSWAAVY